jgi:hypothetical protein
MLVQLLLCHAHHYLCLPGPALNSVQVDMLVGDIYGGKDYASVGLSASTIASSFGKVVGQDKELGEYNPAGGWRRNSLSFRSLRQGQPLSSACGCMECCVGFWVVGQDKEMEEYNPAGGLCCLL